jgi:hypothetical protein
LTGFSTGTDSYTWTNVSDFVKGFADGFAWCEGTDVNSKLTIVVGTNNSLNSSLTFSYGAAFHNHVNTIATLISGQSYSSRVTVVGGSDMEQDFGGGSSVSGSRAWIDGYVSTGGVGAVNSSAASGCRTTTHNGSDPCNNGWTTADVYYVNDAANVYPMPQVYASGNAPQWQQISAYSYAQYGYKIRFEGMMTSYSSCHPVWRNGCAGADWAPDQGYNALQSALNANQNTAYTVPFATDIAHTQEALAGTLPTFP